MEELHDYSLSNDLSYHKISFSYSTRAIVVLSWIIDDSPVPPGPENSRPADLDPDFSVISQDLSKTTLT